MARVLYSSQSYVPSRRADSVHVMHMCEALARAGHDVELLTKRCPARYEPTEEDDLAFYGVTTSFAIRKLPRPAVRGGGLVFSLAVSRRLKQVARRTDLAYCRFLWGARQAVARGIPTVYEAHGLPRGRLAGRWFRSVLTSGNLQRLVVITAGLLGDLQRHYPIPMEKTLIAPDGVRSGFVEAVAPPDNLPSRPRVGYVGHLYEGRGIPIVIGLARRFPGLDFEIIGGHDDAIEDWRRRAAVSNLTFSGFIAPRLLPAAYSRFDILLMPYEYEVGVQSGRSDTARWMSPMKLFEYMATGRPIIATALPALEEILVHGKNALLAEAESIDTWEDALQRLVSDSDLGQRLGARARLEVKENYTWDVRVASLLQGLV